MGRLWMWMWMVDGERGEGRGEAERSDGRWDERTMGAGRNSALCYATSRALLNPLAQRREDNRIVVFNWGIQLGREKRKEKTQGMISSGHKVMISLEILWGNNNSPGKNCG